MSLNGLNILCVVPARGGSKSIPRKNLKEVAGISLVGRAALTVEKVDWIDAAIISTDDDEIADEARRYGLDVPFMRPVKLASDTATSKDMWLHAWQKAEIFYKKRFDISVLIEPTSPLRTPEDIQKSIKMVIDGASAVITVSPTPAHYTPEKTLVIKEENKLAYYIGSQGAKYHNRQSIPEYFHRNGACYAITRKHFIEDDMFLEGASALVIKRPLVNIDEDIELELAELLLSRKSK